MEVHQPYTSTMIAVKSLTKELTKKKDIMCQFAFSGRHVEQSVWVISQRYIAVLKDI